MAFHTGKTMAPLGGSKMAALPSSQGTSGSLQLFPGLWAQPQVCHCVPV